MTSIAVNAKRVIDSSKLTYSAKRTADIAAVQDLVEAVCRTYDMAFLKSTDESTFVSKVVDSAMNDRVPGYWCRPETCYTGGFWGWPGGQVPDHVKADITAVYEAIRRCGLLDVPNGKLAIEMVENGIDGNLKKKVLDHLSYRANV